MRLFPSKRHTLWSAAAPDQVTMRRAYPDDSAALARLAALDCGRIPTGDVLVAGLEAPPVDRIDEEVRELARDPAVLGAVESREGRQIKFV